MRRPGLSILRRAAVACMAIVAFGGFACAAYAGEGAFGIIYTGDKSDFLTPGSEVFSQVDNGMPGDVFAGNLTVTNASQGPCEVSVRVQDVVANGPNDMLERIPLTLESGSDVVFDGALAEASVAEPVSVGTLQVGETLDMDCLAVIPSELTNEYADAAVGMNMLVSIENREVGDATGLVPTGSTDSGNGAGLVHTGDTLSAVLCVLGTLAAAGAVIWCAWKRRMRMW